MNAGWTSAEREALSRRCLPLGEVIGLIEQSGCDMHCTEPGRPCDPRACPARASDAGFAGLITLNEFNLIAGRS